LIDGQEAMLPGIIERGVDDSYWYLKTETAYCGVLSSYENDLIYFADKYSNKFQLVLNKAQYARYAEMLDKPVEVTGQVFKGVNRHHKTDQLIDVSLIAPAQVRTGHVNLSESEQRCSASYLANDYAAALSQCMTSSQKEETYLNQLNIGNMYLLGLGVPVNYDLAFKHLHKALLYPGSDGTAEHNLAYAYSNGIGLEQDKYKALVLYTRASFSGHEGAQYNAAIAYLNGKGVSMNENEGYAWLLIAAASGSEDAARILPEVAANLQKSDRVAGQNRADEISRYLPKSRIERTEALIEQTKKSGLIQIKESR